MNGIVIFWIFVAVILGITESITMSLTSIWGALAAVLCAVFASFGLSLKYCIYLFIVATAVLLLCTRPFVRRFLVKENHPTNADRIIGAEGIVVKNVTTDNPGEIKVMGQFWSAVSDENIEIAEGTRVIVRSIEGVKVKVEVV